MLPEEIRLAFLAQLRSYTDSIKSYVDDVVNKVAGYKSIPKSIVVSNYNLIAEDHTAYFTLTGIVDRTITVRPQSIIEFPVYFECRLCQLDEGVLTVVPYDSNVNIITNVEGDLSTHGKGTSRLLKRVGLNMFVLE